MLSISLPTVHLQGGLLSEELREAPKRLHSSGLFATCLLWYNDPWKQALYIAFNVTKQEIRSKPYNADREEDKLS